MKICVLLSVIFLAVFDVTAAGLKVKVGSSPTVTSAGIFLAFEKAYFKDENLDVDLTIFNNSGAPMTLLLAQGELDVGAGNITAGLFNAINQGQKFKIVADKGHIRDDRRQVALVVRKDLVTEGKFETLADLKGLKISLPSLDGSSQQIVIDRILTKNGLSAKDVQFVKLSYAEANVALRTRAIDATVTLEPYLTQALLDQLGEVKASSQDYAPDQQSGALFYSSQFMQKQNKAAVGFAKAYLRGVRLYNQSLSDPKLALEVRKLLKKHIKIENEQVWEKMIPAGLEDNGDLRIDSLMADLAWYLEKSYITKIPRREDIFDPSYMQQAAKALGDRKGDRKSDK